MLRYRAKLNRSLITTHSFQSGVLEEGTIEHAGMRQV